MGLGPSQRNLGLVEAGIPLTVIDQDDHLARDLREGPARAVDLLPTQQLPALPLGHLLDGRRRDAQTADHIVVEQHHPAAGDRAHGQLRAARHAQLPDHEDINGAPKAVATSYATGCPREAAP